MSHHDRGYDDRGGSRGGGGGGGFQKSFVGKKRERGGEPPVDPKHQLVIKLMSLGDRQQGYEGHLSNEAIFEDAVRMCKREIAQKRENLVELLLDCIVEITAKTPHYALLTGLLNIEASDTVLALLDEAHGSFERALRSGDVMRARLLLRYLTCLVSVNVLHATSVLLLLHALVDTARDVASGSADTSGHTWQPWSDQLVYVVVAVLPWSGAELAESSATEVARLMDSIQAYMDARPIREDADARPFFGAKVQGDDPPARGDSGSASFLSDAWAAVQRCQQDGWKVESIPTLHTPFHIKLAGSTAHELPECRVPRTPPVVPEDASPVLAAALLKKAFPPRGGLRLTDAQSAQASSTPPIERWVAEEFVLDTVAAFDGNRAECVKRLVAGCESHRAMLAEVLFGAMLALPQPRLHPLAYNTVLVELCKVPQFQFARHLGGCVRGLFERVPWMDPEVRTRFISWLSYHLSNFGFQWPWDRWAWVVDEPTSHPQRQFCQELMARLIRLSFWERVEQSLPERFKELLGPAPEVPELSQLQQRPERRGPDDAAGEDGGGEGQEQQPEGDKEAPADEDVAEPLPDPEASAAAASVAAPGSPASLLRSPPRELVLAGQLLSAIRGKASSDEALEWLQANVTAEGEDGDDAMQGEAAGPGDKNRRMLQVAVRALLAAGSKSPSHLSVALERYTRLLSELLDKCGGRDAQQILLEQASLFYAALPQKMLMVVDRLLALRLAQPQQIVEWAVRTAMQPPSSGGSSGSSMDQALERDAGGAEAMEADAENGGAGGGPSAAGGSEKAHTPAGVPSSSAWEVLYYCMDRALLRAPELRERMRRQEEQVEVLKEKAASASDRAAAASEAMPVPSSSNERDIKHALGAVERANTDERVATAKLREAQLELDSVLGQVDGAEAEGADTLLLAYRAFAAQLRALEAQEQEGQQEVQAQEPEEEKERKEETEAAADGTAMVEGDDAATAAAAAATEPVAPSPAPLPSRLECMYQQLRAFTRRYRVDSAAVAGRLEEEVLGGGAEGQVPERVAREVRGLLHTELSSLMQADDDGGR